MIAEELLENRTENVEEDEDEIIAESLEKIRVDDDAHAQNLIDFHLAMISSFGYLSYSTFKTEDLMYP